jgi:DNA (cytosine-5)-methyltransferase 1
MRAVVTQGFSVVGLFAGIGGIEVGLHDAGHETVMLCDFDAASQAVLAKRFGGVPLVGDVRELVALPRADLVAAGFPCQDLSQAGRTAGINGSRSGLVSEVFRLVRDADPTWLLLENVPFMLQLERGEAMRYLTAEIEQLGFRWAYRVVDARSFGVPQRRQRVLFLASRTEDPREVLFHGDAGEPPVPNDISRLACGFYWTEGIRGLGWAIDAVPTLKGGSTIGIPSPPAIRFPDGFIGTPHIRDAERLQGFQPDWTAPAEEAGLRRGARWKLVGNAVSVPMARWLGRRLSDLREYDSTDDARLAPGAAWPRAAWGGFGTGVHRSELSVWPVHDAYQHLESFLEEDAAPLSERASLGFLERAGRSSLNFPEGLLADVEAHARRMRTQQVLVA